jgi:hypothetical protein
VSAFMSCNDDVNTILPSQAWQRCATFAHVGEQAPVIMDYEGLRADSVLPVSALSAQAAALAARSLLIVYMSQCVRDVRVQLHPALCGGAPAGAGGAADAEPSEHDGALPRHHAERQGNNLLEPSRACMACQ